MTRLFFEMNAPDIDTRIAIESRPPLSPLVHVHELREGGTVMSDDSVRVTAALVDHPPVVPPFAYRFDARDCSLVISGDTAPSQNLVTLAVGADVLVHSVMYPPAIDRLVARVSNAAAPKAEYPDDERGQQRPTDGDPNGRSCWAVAVRKMHTDFGHAPSPRRPLLAAIRVHYTVQRRKGLRRRSGTRCGNRPRHPAIDFGLCFQYFTAQGDFTIELVNEKTVAPPKGGPELSP